MACYGSVQARVIVVVLTLSVVVARHDEVHVVVGVGLVAPRDRGGRRATTVGGGGRGRGHRHGPRLLLGGRVLLT